MLLDAVEKSLCSIIFKLSALCTNFRFSLCILRLDASMVIKARDQANDMFSIARELDRKYFFLFDVLSQLMSPSWNGFFFIFFLNSILYEEKSRMMRWSEARLLINVLINYASERIARILQEERKKRKKKEKKIEEKVERDPAASRGARTIFDIICILCGFVSKRA